MDKYKARRYSCDIPKYLRKSAARRLGKQLDMEFVQTESPDPYLFPELKNAQSWVNCQYLVLLRSLETPWGLASHLHVQRLDGRPIHKWKDLQAVKNALAGPDAVAVEMYPRKQDVVDDCHHYHLWILPEGLTLPFNLATREGL